ncbi:pilus assembly protein CpaE [Herbiconiux sp. VKM Ac-2851]|uniref:pilus assembly protein CpaE n=1 Tax=Herbiconiux sp. VKM Ac-2851 TaxID=2739025 RepID=UPI001566450D|nr:pilus assembly protein CpaE [Herbiconiux sp. VKM Ac-2851]NQX33509.1 pilus assembly protein CpaE [Herbiconiux sp. VKM Ac-2851]
MISIELARALRTAGLRWHPRSGDGFVIETAEAGGEVYTVSEMTVEVHEHPGGSLIGFNGTTEWALDSVDLGDTLWLPREDQLRELLRDGFVSLTTERVDGDTLYLVTAVIRGDERRYEALSAVDAYGEAVLDLIVRSLVADDEAGVGRES